MVEQLHMKGPLVRFAQEMLSQITLEVCGSILGLERVRVATEPDFEAVVECLEGRIRITGEWDLELRIICPKPAAELLAAEMFNMSPTEVTTADVRDAFGEAINVIGSNVKSVLGGQSQLSYPRISTIHVGASRNESESSASLPNDVLTVHLLDTAGAKAVLC
jgi:Chemotaxis phosphatase CheX